MDIIIVGRKRPSVDQESDLLPLCERHAVIFLTSMTKSIVERHVALDTETDIVSRIVTRTATMSVAGIVTGMLIEIEIWKTRTCAAIKVL